MQMGSPSDFVLLECGPGRGTLMADMMRAVSGVDGFVKAARLHLLEISPALKAKQTEVLSDSSPQWIERIEDVPNDVPIIMIANEFFDALAFRSLIYLDGAWFERVIDVHDDAFVFGTRPCPQALWPQFGQDVTPRVGDVYEFSSARISFMEALCQRIKAHGGAGLVIDYGHEKSAFGDTFQAIKGHESVSVLEHIGDADLTSHVDFEPLYDVIAAHGIAAQPLTGQGAFLKLLGIEQRAAYLRDKGAVSIENDLHRLTDETKMGALFKIMDFRYGA